MFIHPETANECFKGGPSFNALANYLLNYGQLIFLDCLTGPVLALQARQSELYKYDTASFAAKSTYKTEKGNDIWGHEVSVHSTYNLDVGQRPPSETKASPSSIVLPINKEPISKVNEVSKPEPTTHAQVKKGMITVIKEEDFDEEIVRGVTNSKR